MWNQENQFNATGTAFGNTTVLDTGLRAQMVRIFNTVAAGLGVSGLVAFFVSQSPALLQAIMNPVAMIVLAIGMIAFAFIAMRPQALLNGSVAAAQTKFYAFCAILGITLAPIFIIYTGASVTRVFFITAAAFAGMSLFGYTTKRDLTGIASFLIMGLIGVIVASVVNIFLKSSGLAFVVSLISVVIFTGLIAFEAQAAKRSYTGNDTTDRKLAVLHAFGLYLNFINLFQTLLSLLGNRN